MADAGLAVNLQKAVEGLSSDGQHHIMRLGCKIISSNCALAMQLLPPYPLRSRQILLHYIHSPGDFKRHLHRIESFILLKP